MCLLAAPFIGDLIAVAIWALIQLNVILLLHKLVRSFPIKKALLLPPHRAIVLGWLRGAPIPVPPELERGYRRPDRRSRWLKPWPFPLPPTNSSAAFRGLLAAAIALALRVWAGGCCSPWRSGVLSLGVLCRCSARCSAGPTCVC